MDETIYTESEILNFIVGLDLFYHEKPWYIKWYWKPWHSALNILASQLCGHLLNVKADYQNAINEAEDLLQR